MINPLKAILLKVTIGVGTIITTEHIEFRDELEHPTPIFVEEAKELHEMAYVMEATFYTARCKGCSGVTKSGHDVRNTIYAEGYRVIAVDPKVIQLGSIVKVTLENGMSFEAIASDIGGDIKKMRIDVLVSTKKEAYKLGRQKARVLVIE